MNFVLHVVEANQGSDFNSEDWSPLKPGGQGGAAASPTLANPRSHSEEEGELRVLLNHQTGGARRSARCLPGVVRMLSPLNEVTSP